MSVCDNMSLVPCGITNDSKLTWYWELKHDLGKSSQCS